MSCFVTDREHFGFIGGGGAFLLPIGNIFCFLYSFVIECYRTVSFN